VIFVSTETTPFPILAQLVLTKILGISDSEFVESQLAVTVACYGG
jgi:hypothetical protein